MRLKKITALLLTVIMAIALFPAGVFAKNYDKTGTLTVEYIRGGQKIAEEILDFEYKNHKIGITDLQNVPEGYKITENRFYYNEGKNSTEYVQLKEISGSYYIKADNGYWVAKGNEATVTVNVGESRNDMSKLTYHLDPFITLGYWREGVDSEIKEVNYVETGKATGQIDVNLGNGGIVLFVKSDSRWVTQFTRRLLEGSDYEAGVYVPLNDSVLNSHKGAWFYNKALEAKENGYTYFFWFSTQGGLKHWEFEITADYSPIKVKYNTNGGSGDFEEKTFNINDSNKDFTIPENEPTKKDMNFLGWKLTADDQAGRLFYPNNELSVDSEFISIAQNNPQDNFYMLEFVAQYQDKDRFGVTGSFDKKGTGTVTNGSQQNIVAGDSSLPMVFTAANGYTIKTITVNGDPKALPENTKTYTVPAVTNINENHNAVATAVEDKNVTISYEAQKGGKVEKQSEEVAPVTGEPLGTTAEADTGYKFTGWYVGDELVTDEPILTKNDIALFAKENNLFVATTFTARFEKQKYKLEVTEEYKDVNGDVIDDMGGVTQEDIGFGAKVTIDAPVVPSKYFVFEGAEVYVDGSLKTNDELTAMGITTAKDGMEISISAMPEHQIKIVFSYQELNKYTLTYTSEGGSKVTNMPGAVEGLIMGEKVDISTIEPRRAGFLFTGWESGTEGVAITEGSLTMPEKDVELKASWQATEDVYSYDINYYMDEEIFATDKGAVLQNNPVVTEVTHKTPEGYKLKGYSLDDGGITPELNVSIEGDGNTINVYYEKNDLTVKHVYGNSTVYDKDQSQEDLEEGEQVTINMVRTGRYNNVSDVTVNGESRGRVNAVEITPTGSDKYDVVFTYVRDADEETGGGGGGETATEKPKGDSTITIEDPEVPLASGLETTEHFAYVFGYPDDTVRPNNTITREEVAAIFYRLLTDDYRNSLFTTAQSFSDVSGWSNNAVATLLNGKIISGYKDGTFKPQSPITRGEFASIVTRFDSLTYSGNDMFSDIGGHWANSAINAAASKGWITGYSDGTFKPESYITRAEAMALINKVLNRTLDTQSLHQNTKHWVDNNPTDWFYGDVLEATNSHDYGREYVGGPENWTEITQNKTWK